MSRNMVLITLDGLIYLDFFCRIFDIKKANTPCLSCDIGYCMCINIKKKITDLRKKTELHSVGTKWMNFLKYGYFCTVK